MSTVPSTYDLLLIHDNLERQVMAARTYILSGELRLAKQSLAYANTNINRLNTGILRIEAITKGELK